MYIPSSFEEKDSDILLKIMKDNAFATIISTDEKGEILASHLPFLISHKNEKIYLRAHFAKANPHWKLLNNCSRTLVIFQGPHCYISPSWYNNSGVPTWNYVSVHTYGICNILDDPEQLRFIIEELSEKYEKLQLKPWKATNNYPDKMLEAIVGFEITVQEIQGKVKIGQNKTKDDLESVIKCIDTLPSSKSSHQEKEIAILIKKYLESKD